MEFNFVIDPRISAPTEIFVPPLYFGEGMVVAVSNSVDYSFDKDNHVLMVKPKDTVSEPVEVKVYVTPKYS